MQRDILLLTEMIDAAEQARQLTADITVSQLETDRQRRDALLWNFTVLGEAAGQLSAELNPAAVLPVPARAAGRLLDGGLGLDTGWLIPAAAVVAVWGIASRRRLAIPRGDPLRACFILWGGWLVTFFAVFSAITTPSATASRAVGSRPASGTRTAGIAGMT